MGNSSVVGEAMNTCGCTGALGFETSAKALINFHSIEPWNARDLVKDNLRRQGELARRSPLHSVPIEDGLQFIGAKARGWFQTKLSREQFVQTCVELMVARNVPHTQKDKEELYLIFDSMDFDGNGTLSLGEWAGGLSVFFKGNTEQCVRAVFHTLDSDRSQTLTKKELQEYLKPFVKAMSPPEADSLRPILLKKATDDIYEEMDIDHHNDISSQEMLDWTQRGNNIIDRLADIIDKEVYQIWLAESHKRVARDRLKGDAEGPTLQQNAYPGSQDQYAAEPSQLRGPSPLSPRYMGAGGGVPSYGPPLQSGPQVPPQAAPQSQPQLRPLQQAPSWSGLPVNGLSQAGSWPALVPHPGSPIHPPPPGSPVHAPPGEMRRPESLQSRMPPPPPPAVGQDPFRGPAMPPPPPPVQAGVPMGNTYGAWSARG